MLEFRQVSKRHGAQVVLDGVSLRVSAGERVGIVGPNGAGKSTLFELIAGGMAPDSGTVAVHPGLRIGWLQQQVPAANLDVPLLRHAVTAVPDLEEIRAETARLEAEAERADGDGDARRLLRRLGELQAAFEAAGGYGQEARAAAALAGLGFREREMQRPLRDFSGGWRMRAELARALLAEPDLLLLDEPSNYLDLPAVEWLRRRLEAFRGTLLLISHDRYLLESLTTITCEVAGGAVTRYPGPYSFYAAERGKRREVLLARQAAEDRRRAQVQRFVDRFRAKSSLSTRVQNKIKLLERMDEARTVVEPLARGRSAFRLAAPPHCGDEVMRWEGLGFSYDGGQRWIFRGISGDLHKGEKIAVVGPNGAGKTTFLRVVAGMLRATEGTCRAGHLVRPGYQSQESAETMPPLFSCLEVMKAAGPDAAESEIRTLLGGFGFTGEAAEKRVGVLSGGERIRLAFARLLLRPPNLLLLDEPTTHLDVESREALQDALKAYAGTVLFVSHDVEFVRAVAQGILAIAPDGAGVRRYPGGYGYFLEKAPQDAEFWRAFCGNAAPPPTAAEAEAGAAKADRRAALADRKAAKNELKKVEAAIAAAETAIAELEERIGSLQMELGSPSLSQADRKAVAARLKEAQTALDAQNLAWEAALRRQEELAPP